MGLRESGETHVTLCVHCAFRTQAENCRTGKSQVSDDCVWGEASILDKGKNMCEGPKNQLVL